MPPTSAGRDGHDTSPVSRLARVQAYPNPAGGANEQAGRCALQESLQPAPDCSLDSEKVQG